MLGGPVNNSLTALSSHVDDVCLRFQDSLKKASSTEQLPELEGFLADTQEPLRSELLRELVGLEVDYRRRLGENPQAEEYLARFPALNRPWLDNLFGTEGRSTGWTTLDSGWTTMDSGLSTRGTAPPPS